MINVRRGDCVELKSYEECVACFNRDSLPPRGSRVWLKKIYFVADMSSGFHNFYNLMDANWWFPEECIKEVVYNDAVLD